MTLNLYGRYTENVLKLLSASQVYFQLLFLLFFRYEFVLVAASPLSFTTIDKAAVTGWGSH